MDEAANHLVDTVYRARARAIVLSDLVAVYAALPVHPTAGRMWLRWHRTCGLVVVQAWW